MKLELLEKASTDKRVMPVVRAAWNLEPTSEEELIMIARNVNEELGYELFDNFEVDKLREDFVTVTSMVTKRALSSDRGDGKTMKKNLTSLEVSDKLPQIVDNIATEYGIKLTDFIGRFSYPLKKEDREAMLKIYPNFNGQEGEWEIFLVREGLDDFKIKVSDTSEIPEGIRNILKTV